MRAASVADAGEHGRNLWVGVRRARSGGLQLCLLGRSGSVRSADDPRHVEVLRGLDRRLSGQVLAPARPFLRNAAAQEKEIGPEIELETAEILVELASPRLPAEAAPLARCTAEPHLGVLAVELEMTEFGVWHQHAVDEQCAADPGSQR